MIADAGIRIIARDGVRALTHRAVDREAGLSPGSSSYYVPTRKALIDVIVQALAERSVADAERGTGTTAHRSGHLPAVDADELAASVVDLIEAYASRPTEMRTRYALLLELDADDPARAVLSQESPVQQRMLEPVTEALHGLGVADAAAHAQELFVLADALLVHRVVNGCDASSTHAVVSAYLRGIVSMR